MSLTSPKLWVVATPLGNPGDLSPRAREVLEGADMGGMERMRDFIQPFWCRVIQKGDQDAAEWPQYSEQKPVHKIFDNKDNGLMEIIL